MRKQGCNPMRPSFKSIEWNAIREFATVSFDNKTRHAGSEQYVTVIEQLILDASEFLTFKEIIETTNPFSIWILIIRILWYTNSLKSSLPFVLVSRSDNRNDWIWLGKNS